MFLNIFLFFMNMFFISFVSMYAKYLFTDLDYMDKLNNKIEIAKNKPRKDFSEQKSYVELIQEKKDIEFNLFPFRVGIFVVAIIMALLISRTEPLVIFGFKLGMFSIIFVMILLGFLNQKLLKLLGVKL